MKKMIITLSVAAAVGISTVFAVIPAGNVQAASSSMADLKNKSNEIQSKSKDVQNELKNKNSELENIQSEQDKVTTDINRIDLAIGDTETKIAEKAQQITEKDAEVDKLNKEIDVISKRIEERNELLKGRARSYQESGGMVSYLDVLVGAQSFSEFIDRIGAVATIMEADQNIIKEQKADKESLEKKQAKVKKDLDALNTMRKELETLKADLDTQKAEKSQMMASLEQQETEVSQLVVSLEEEQAILAGQNAAIQKAIELEKQRQAAAQRSNISSGGSTSGAPAVSSGTFTRPAAGRISSGFGYRSGGFHYGVDIAKSGSVPVVAAADGVVMRSYYSSSYGNCIMITHSVNGQTYTTVYAHLSSRAVGDGAVVSKGQFIGYMGNTGNSFGQHLHFELHRGAWNAAKSNAINPAGVVPL